MDGKSAFTTLLIGVAFVFICAMFFGFSSGSWMQSSIQDNWSPRDYTVSNGDCWVPPQGDPLYDEHYAQQVNPFNCQSMVDQSQSRYIDAQASNLNSETVRENSYLFLVGFIFVGAILFIVYAILKGG